MEVGAGGSGGGGGGGLSVCVEKGVGFIGEEVVGI